LWGVLLKYNPVSRVTVFGFMNPMFGVVLSAIFLGESGQALTWNTFVALILVCLGIYVVNRKGDVKTAG
ncbi:MAG: EamA family transporter, partial [Lachnospiraceae bacterium]|nr:EamA family transporter [Lachnospiraceae bacterium]